MKYIVGIDIGGTKIEGVLWDGKKVLKSIKIPTPDNLKDFKKSVLGLYLRLSRGNSIAAGIAIPGLADKFGKIIYVPNVKYLVGFAMLNFIKKNCGLKTVVVQNDAKCFSLAEAKIGEGARFQIFAGITLGTGIGGSLMSFGTPNSSLHGSQGEFGHMLANEKFTYEQYYKKYKGSGDFKKNAQLLGRLFANIFNIADVEAIILGGSFAINQPKNFFRLAITEAQRFVLNPQIRPMIKVTKLKSAGAVGAALLATNKKI